MAPSVGADIRTSGGPSIFAGATSPDIGIGGTIEAVVEIRRGGIRHQVQPRVKSAFALHAAADLKDHDIHVAAIFQAMADLFARLEPDAIAR